MPIPPRGVPRHTPPSPSSWRRPLVVGLLGWALAGCASRPPPTGPVATDGPPEASGDATDPTASAAPRAPAVPDHPARASFQGTWQARQAWMRWTLGPAEDAAREEDAPARVVLTGVMLTDGSPVVPRDLRWDDAGRLHFDATFPTGAVVHHTWGMSDLGVLFEERTGDVTDRRHLLLPGAFTDARPGGARPGEARPGEEQPGEATRP